MTVEITPAEYEAVLRKDFVTFVERCFSDLNPQAEFATNWHIEVVAAKLAAVQQGKCRRLIINLPPRHLKSLLASIAFPAWCLGITRRCRSSAAATHWNSPTSSPAIAAAS
jgi:hypothetical protein